ncbi:hypothetical protein ACVQFK_001294 [Yersinia enterocolitica]
MNKLTEQEFTRKPDGGLADQIEVLEAMAEGDTDNTELLMLLIELLSLREQLAELKSMEPVAEMRTWPKNISGPNPDWFWFGKQDFPVGTQLFTAAKPAED